MGIVRVRVILGENFLWWGFSGWELSGGNHLGGNFPGGIFPSTLEASTNLSVKKKRVKSDQFFSGTQYFSADQ